MVFPDTTSLLLFSVSAFVLIGILSDAVYALVAGSLALRLRASAHAVRLRRWLSGSVYLALGVGAALVGAGDEPNH